MGASIRLPQFAMDLPTYHLKVAQALADPASQIYLDTSILMWLLKIGSGARTEFLQWCSKPSRSSQVFVPAWSAHELYRHLREDTVYVQRGCSAKSSLSALNRLIEEVDETCDDSLCVGTFFTNRLDAIERVRRSANELKSLLEQYNSSRDLYDNAVAELISFVNLHAMESDPFQLVEDIAPGYENRFLGKVPPGYEDGGKPENAFGDVIFWREILTHAKKAPSILVLSNDAKPDWRHLPRMITIKGRALQNKSFAGAELQLPHPLLEFEAELSGIKKIEVINASVLSIVLEITDPGSAPLLLGAAFPRGFNTKQEAPNWKGLGIGRAAPPTGKKGEPPERPLDLLAVAFSDVRSYQVPTGIAESFAQLKGAFEERRAAADKILNPESFNDLDAVAMVWLGRAIGECALTHPESISIADALATIHNISEKREIAAFLGMLVAIYFDDRFTPRATPFGRPSQALLALSMEERYAAATARIVVFLRSQGVWLLVEPDSPVTPIEVSLRLTPTGEGKRKRLDSIVIGEQELLDEAASPDRSLNTFLGTQGASLQELLKLLAMEFTVPFSLLRANYNLSTPLEWNDSAGLSVMRTDQKSILTNLQLSFIDENTEEANG